MITGAQIRASRALLKWSGRDLAERTNLSYAAVQRAEQSDEIPNMHTKNLAAVQAALEAGGIEFIENGVKLRKETK